MIDKLTQKISEWGRWEKKDSLYVYEPATDIEKLRDIHKIDIYLKTVEEDSENEGEYRITYKKVKTAEVTAGTEEDDNPYHPVIDPEDGWVYWGGPILPKDEHEFVYERVGRFDVVGERYV